MREGDSPHNQHHPTAMSTLIETALSKIYLFLLVRTGALCMSLHRHCTAKPGTIAGDR